MIERSATSSWVISLVLFAWLAPVMAVAAGGMGLPGVVAVLAGAIAAGVLTFWWTPRLAVVLQPAASLGRGWLLVMALIALAAIVQMARLSVYMHDWNRASYSVTPDNQFRVRHSCLTAYAEAARFAYARDRNIYELQHYQPRQIGPLRVDVFHYPPPFLLMPAAVDWVTPDFQGVRAVWFALQALILPGAMLFVGWWIGGVSGALAAAAVGLPLAVPATLATYQQGNFQITAMPLAMVGVALIWSQREKRGAALLAYCVVGKIFPGVLIAWLAGARRWRALVLVTLAAAIMTGAAIMLFGWGPMHDFVTYEIPRISNGEAFPQSEGRAVAANYSVYGLTVRLRNLGLTAVQAPVGRAVASGYGVLVLVLALAAGWYSRRSHDDAMSRLALAQLWLALLNLASFRSPFVGMVYGAAGTFWLLTLLIAGAQGTGRRMGWLCVFAVLGGAFALVPSPSDAPASAFGLWWSGVHMAGILALNVWVALSRLRAAIARGEPIVAPAQAITPAAV